MSNFLPLCIRHILEQTEWTPHEISVYSSLLEKGAMDLSRVSLETNIGVSSAQYALKRLHSKKMVKKFLVNSKPRWKASDIEAPRRWVEGHTKQFQRNEEAVQRFIDQYDFSTEGFTANVEFYEGIKAVQKSLLKIGERCMSKEVLAVALLEGKANQELIQFMQKEYASLRANKGINVKLLVSGEEEMIKQSVCQISRMSIRKAEQLFRGAMNCANAVIHIVDDTIYMMHFAEEGPCSFAIEHQPMAAVLRGMFQCLWDVDCD